MELRQSRVADKAWQCIVDTQKKEFFKEYGTRTQDFPAMLLRSGLAQSLGFLRAKKGSGTNLEKAYEAYSRHIFEIVKVAGFASIDADVFYNNVLKCELTEYRYISQLVMDAAIWLKRLYEGAKDQTDE